MEEYNILTWIICGVIALYLTVAYSTWRDDKKEMDRIRRKNRTLWELNKKGNQNGNRKG